MIDLETLIPRLVNDGVEFVIIGGVAATAHGSAYITEDLDICYARNAPNLERVVASLAPFHPRLRGAPAGLPFLWDAKTLQQGLNFTLRTDLGDVDLLGEVAGLGAFEQVRAAAVRATLFGVECAVLSLDGLIAAKRAAGRTKDQLILPELEALREAQRKPD
ncbi:MAG: hypothetical protein A3F84_19410 [Candidatus Handelsmanbacteria bacterium RIFCSPLOWO2_12_FULL_64_10]|uniref:Nucleotidyltransferase n=1 Tax=Handelsmanbacteria sp. (strain RIFCSPLOWO2_12_FULL_64_10) TaxID=1817868 RepID=A0A1F6CSS1_HANXR|nr:MAG: hypothetical protein A3F84_19410 [Candidatus Handelsmanbacteria bacterium RIFCSPLOWO2_12_FULL_64_10]